MYNVKVYNKEDLVSEITVDREEVSFKNYSDLVIILPFGIKETANYDDLMEFYESRCFPKARVNCKQVLRSLDLDFYDPEMICRKTHGQQFDDFIWLQFSDEPQVRYKDIKMRD